MNKPATVLLLLLCFSFGCKAPKKAMASEPAQETITDLSNKKVIKNKDLFAVTNDVLPIDTVYLNRDTLHVLTQKLQACDASNFNLMWNGAMAKSLPPQASVKLFLLADANCKEMHNFHLTFNVHDVRLKSDSTNNGSTVIRLGGWHNSVKYEY